LKTSISGASAAPLLTDMAGFKHLEGALKPSSTSPVPAARPGPIQIAAENRHVGFSDGAIRDIDTANVYNNRQTED
jgi:AsmA protein